MAQQTLDIHSHLAMLGSLGEEGAVKIAVDQACEVGVIRRSNGKPLGPSGFMGFVQICGELQENPGAIAVQCLRGFLR